MAKENKQQEKPQQAKPTQAKPQPTQYRPQENKDFKHLVRISNTDLPGDKHIISALRNIKGVDFMFASALCVLANVEKIKKSGDLSDDEIKRLEDVLHNPAKYNIPIWMFNRRRDYETGKDAHLLSADLEFVQDNDIKRMKMIRSYKGVRHSYGQPVRGQRTKSHFRKNKGKVMGVKKNPKSKSGKV